MSEQPVPENASCPECGGDAVSPDHTLSALGYKHDDQRFQCVDCHNRWTAGVPIGEIDEHYWEDLVCGSCGDFGLVHRIRPGDGLLGIHMKCPNDCYNYWQIQRVLGDANLALMGYPQITGEIGDAENWSIDGEIDPQYIDEPIGDRTEKDDIEPSDEKNVQESVSTSLRRQ